MINAMHLDANNHAQSKALDQQFNTLLSKLASKQSQRQLQDKLRQSTSHFLGSYAETLWLHYLEHHPRYELIAHNLQIHEQGKTVGEFDFIVFDTLHKTHVHQELAIKFYLGHKHQWIGPQTVDRLDLKASKLKEKQLKLSQHAAAKETLASLGVATLTHECIVKGRLFQPEGYTDASNCSIPIYVNDTHLKSTWYRHKHFKPTSNNDETYWKILNKREWMAPLTLDQHDPHNKCIARYDLDHYLDKHFADQGRPVMLGRFKAQNGQFIETDKYFIVSDKWPNDTQKQTV